MTGATLPVSSESTTSKIVTNPMIAMRPPPAALFVAIV